MSQGVENENCLPKTAWPPTSSSSGKVGSGNTDKEVIYVPTPTFGGRNVGSYLGKISNCVVGAYSLGVAPTTEVKTADIDYFTVDFSISTAHYAGSIYFGVNTQNLSVDNPFKYYFSESVLENDTGMYGVYDMYYQFSSDGEKYFENKSGLSITPQDNLNVTLIYKVNHDDYKSLECKAYVDGVHVATQTFSYFSNQELIKYVTLKSEYEFDSSFEYLEMNVFDKGYDGPLVEFYDDDTKNLSDCTDAYMNYRNAA